MTSVAKLCTREEVERRIDRAVIKVRREVSGGLSARGIAALGFDEMCRCGHEFGMHDPARCAVYRCECGGFIKCSNNKC